MRSIMKIWLPIVVIALLAGLWLTLANPDRAPQVSFSTLEGKTLALDSLQGKVVLVNFWATSCPGCIKEMPGLVQTYRDYHGKGFETVAVAMSYDPPSHVLNYAQKNALPFTVALDADGGAAQAFGNVQVTPTSFLIDRQGKIVRRIMGEIDFAAFRRELDELVKDR
jgi:peroxiredoxin